MHMVTWVPSRFGLGNIPNRSLNLECRALPRFLTAAVGAFTALDVSMTENCTTGGYFSIDDLHGVSTVQDSLSRLQRVWEDSAWCISQVK